MDITPKWHEVVQVTHKLQHSPQNVFTKEDAIRVNAKIAYDELDSKQSSNVGNNIPTNVENGKSKAAKWILLGVGSAATITGIVLAAVGNSQAKNASKKEYSSKEEFQKYRKDASSGQSLRGVGLGIIFTGAVGIGLSFAF